MAPKLLYVSGGPGKTDYWASSPKFLVQWVYSGTLDVNVDLEQLLWGAGGQSLQHFGPLYDFPSKVLLKYTSWNIVTYSDTDNDNTPDFYSQFYIVFSSLFLCTLLLNAELSLKSKRTRRLLGQYLLNQIIHLKWKACNIFSSSIIFPDFSLFLFTGENLG